MTTRLFDASVSRQVLNLLVLCLAAATPGTAAFAADSDVETHLREQLHSTTLALREAQDQNAVLTAKDTELTAEVAALKQQLGAAQAKSADAGSADERKLAAADEAIKQNQQLTERANQANQLLEKWQAAYKEAAEVARARDGAAKGFEVKYNQASGNLTQCVAKNGALEQLGKEILDRLDQRGIFSDFAANEPVTQIYRVKLENIIQDYQDKMRDQEVSR